jgi:hypothetical protein
MDDVVSPAVLPQVPEYLEAEVEGRPEGTPSPCIVAAVRCEANDLDACRPRFGAGRPPTLGEVRDTMTLLGKTDREVAHPTLGASDPDRVKAVVDQADPHETR